MNWEEAKRHFDEVREQYLSLRRTPGVNVEFALCFTFDPLSDRYERGERTQDLYDAMMVIE